MTARVLEGRPGEVVIDSIEGDGGRLSLVAAENCVGIAALETLRLMQRQPACGVSLTLKKVRLRPSAHCRLCLCQVLTALAPSCCPVASRPHDSGSCKQLSLQGHKAHQLQQTNMRRDCRWGAGWAAARPARRRAHKR